MLAGGLTGAAGFQAVQTASQGNEVAAFERPPGLLPPNILIAVADDLGVEQLEVYGLGSDFPITPTIDELAATGVLFRNAWANPICSPTRAGILTGRHAFRTGVGNAVLPNTQALPLSETTLPEVLEQGAPSYDHAMFGKWHLGNGTNGGTASANLAGWSDFDGSEYSIGHGASSYYLWDRVINGKSFLETEYATRVHVDAALDWIETAGEPWLVYLPFNDPHSPYDLPPAGLYSQAISSEPTTRQLFKAKVEAMDHELGRMLAGIEARGERAPVVFFLADNGSDDMVSVPPAVTGRVKGTVYEGGVRVPLIVAGWGPQSGSTCDAIVHTTDLFSTVLELVGASEEQLLPDLTIDSRSLVPLLIDPSGPAVHQTLFTEIFAPIGTLPIQSGWRAIRDDRYKLVCDISGHNEDELYDLDEDPWESFDLLQGSLTSEQAAAYASLQASLASLLGSEGLSRR